MALLILLFLKLRRFRPRVPGAAFYRVAAAIWVAGGLLMGLRLQQYGTSLVYVAFAWFYWLVSMEAAAPGWCRKWLQRLDLHHWHGRLDWLSNWCLVAAVAREGRARGWWALAYLVSAGCRYAARPRPVPAAPVQVHISGNTAPVQVLIGQLPAAPVAMPNYYATCALVAHRLNVPVAMVWAANPALVQRLAEQLQQLPPTL